MRFCIQLPTTLQTQDEILLANFPTDNWQLICDETTDRPTILKGALYTIINLQDLCTCGVLTVQGQFLYESMRSCDTPDNKIQLHFTYNRALVNNDSSITAQDSKRYAIKPYPFQAPDLQYFEHKPYLTSNGSLAIRTKRHVPDSDGYKQAIANQQFPLPEAIHKMETQEPIYIGPILPASPQEDTDTDEQPYQASFNTTYEENIFVKTMDAPLSNILFNVITLLNYYSMHFLLIIFIRLSFKPGGWFYNVVFQMTQMSLMKSTTAVRLMEPLITPSPHKPYFILDQPIEDETDIPPTSSSIEQISTIVSFSKIILIVLTSLIISILLWVTFKIFILPIFYKSNICRQLCISCLYNSHTQQSPTTDIFLEVVHIQSGKQIRIFLTTITAPASSLAFTGSVRLRNFKVSSKKLQLFVKIDWHNCLLLYNNFIIPLPERGTALFFQPNLLTDFTQQDPFNIMLLTRHLYAMIQIPHVDNTDFMSSDERIHFAIESPYKKVHDEVKRLMPLASSVATGLDEVESDQHLPPV